MRRGPTGRGARTVVCALALLAVASPAAAVAQQPTASTDELSQAILRYAFRYDGGNVRVVPGRVPDDLAPSFYAPPGTRVLGTVVAGSSAVVLATTTTPPDSLRPQYARVLEQRGWKAWQPWNRGGFVPTVAEGPLIFCREGAQLHIAHRHRATPPHDLQLEYREGRGMCEERPSAERAEFVRLDRPRFPTLRSPEPPAARPTSSCHSRGNPRRGGGSSFGTGTTVSTDLRAVELLAHYGRQLETAGWKPGRDATAATLSGSWSQSDSTGVPQVVTIEVTERAPGSGCYDVRMNVER